MSPFHFTMLETEHERKKMAEIYEEHIAMDELEIFFESKTKPIDEQIAISSEYAAICKHMENVDEISRQILIMRYIFGMSYKEIGWELNMTPKHVDTRILRAKEKVRKLIEKEEFEKTAGNKRGE